MRMFILGLIVGGYIGYKYALYKKRIEIKVKCDLVQNNYNGGYIGEVRFKINAYGKAKSCDCIYIRKKGICSKTNKKCFFIDNLYYN